MRSFCIQIVCNLLNACAQKLLRAYPHKPHLRYNLVMNHRPHLTPKQFAFVQEYVTNGRNGTQAAVAAGYSPKTAVAIASENLRKPHIRRAISEIRSTSLDGTRVKVEWVVNQLMETFERCKAGGDERGVLRALELLGKTCGAFPNKVEIEDKRNAAQIILAARKRAGMI